MSLSIKLDLKKGHIHSKDMKILDLLTSRSEYMYTSISAPFNDVGINLQILL